MFPDKWFIIIPIILWAIYATWFGFFGFANPLKITNPESSFFDPYDFRFEDYLRKDALNENLPLILKKGMHKEEVDKILIASGGAFSWNTSSEKAPNISHYCYIPNLYETIRSLRKMSDKQARDITIQYDENDKMKEIWISIKPTLDCDWTNKKR